MITAYYANQALDALITAAGTMEVGLSTTAPVEAPGTTVGASNITEPTAASYDRVNLYAANFGSAAGRVKSTNTAITFPAPLEDWGQIGWVVVWSGARVVFFGALDDLIDVTADSDQIRIPAGTLSLYLPA